jgi:methionine synthase II (cobalamin-independent)
MATKNHQRPPFRAEHMGSLLRPTALSEKRVTLDDKKAVEIAQDTELHHLEDESVTKAIKMQQEIGFHALTDGEYRRHQFWGNFFPNLEGFDEVMAPGWEIFRTWVPDLEAFSKLPWCPAGAKERLKETG